MMMNRWVVTVALIAMLPLVGAADRCESSTGSGGGAVSNSGGRDFQDPNPGPGGPAPAADPGPQNDPKHIRLQVTWKGERGGQVEVTINSVVQPKETVSRPTKDANGTYYGQWQKDMAVAPGYTVGFSWFPDVPGMFAQCVIHYKAQLVDFHQVQSGLCAASYAIPTT